MSTLKVTNIQDTSGGNNSTSEEIFNGRAKAWVNFNGQGTVAIRADFNVNSITDHSTGNYTVNFSNSLSDANYAVSVSAKERDLNGGAAQSAASLRDSTLASDYTSSLVGVQFPNNAFNGFIDPVIMNVMVFR